MASRRLSKLPLLPKSLQYSRPSLQSAATATPHPSQLETSLTSSREDDALPTLSLSPAPASLLARYLHAYLPTDFSPSDLLHFLRRHLLHHPRLAAHDLRVFLWAAAARPDFRHDHRSYAFMALRLAATARLPALRLLLRRALLTHPCPCSHPSIFSCPHLPPVLRAAIHALAAAGRLDDAAATLADIKTASDGPLTSDFYNILMSGYAKHRRHEDALKLFDEMTRDRVKPDAYTFNTIIGSCCRNSTFESALDWFRNMRSNGCEPNVVTFNTLLKGFFIRKRFKEGIGVAREMLALGYKLSTATCEILVDGLCNDGRVAEAGDLVMGFVERGAVPNEFDCLRLVEELCKQGMAERALELVDSLWAKGNDVGIVTCTTLIEGLRHSGKVDEAFRFVGRMLEKGMVPDVITFNCLLEALCDIGRTVDANRLRGLGSRKGLEPDGVTFGILVRGFTREGRKREGEVVVDEMLDGGFIPNIATYNRLMEELRNGTGLYLRYGTRLHS